MQRSVQISEIHVPRGRRTPFKGKVAAMVLSFKTLGQLQPIVLNEDYGLIAGLHRLEAAKSLGWKTIDANVVDLQGLLAELAEIDENLERAGLSALEESQQLARRKAIYLEIHPETSAGTAGVTAKLASQNAVSADAATRSTTDKMSVVENTPSFAKDTAEKTGKTERQVRRDVAIGENISPAAAEVLKDTPTADNKSELEKLSKLPEKEQVRVANRIAKGKASSVSEATKKQATPTDAAQAQVKIWADTVGRWLGQSTSIDDLRAKFPGKHGDRVVKLATDLYEALKLWQKAIQ